MKVEQTQVESCFEQISPLLDDVITYVTAANLSAYEAATVTALSAAHLSSLTALAMLRSKDMAPEIDDATRARLEILLATKVRETDELLNAAFAAVVNQMATRQ